MKIQTLRVLTVSLAVCLAPVAFAAVTINGTQFDSFKMVAAANGDITLTTVPVALTGTVPLLLKAEYDVTVTSLPAGATNIDTIPVFTPVNCIATPLDPACPVEPPPPPPGECGTVGAELVFETMPWSAIHNDVLDNLQGLFLGGG
jgi:hypothetical protein